jgi:quinol-cytochrome oxidoreductase complex cytochrome b subunit
MKPVKFVLLALGALCAIAVFLPFIDVGPIKASFWELRQAKAAPTFIALIGSLALAGLATLGVVKGRFTRGMAAGTAVLGLVIAVITILQFTPEAPFGKVAGTGAKILLGGGLIGFVASIVGLIKPDRATA